MKRLNYLIAVCISGIILSCGSTQLEKSSDELIETLNDAHSYANIDDIRTTHVHLDLEINFENEIVSGVVRHQMGKHTCDTATFDIKGLDIKKVTIGDKDEKETDFEIGDEDEWLGQPLHVKIKPSTEYINIYYQTTEATEAIDWLPASLTSGKTQPFMYTQGQAILTRSWIPIQDSPMNRITYSADIHVPSELLAIMSADNPEEKSLDGNYHFEMKQKIPSYLIALAVGDLTYTSLGDNCGVYSEPELAAKCKYEFEDLPKMIATAEGLYGKYRWDQFDMVILPYSFPFGGMENPRLTFANPTLLAGDQSLVSVVAHELAHSWSGNLVTNATWDDFWLNEGFTVYFENRIMEELYGKEVAEILQVIERQELDVTLDDMENGDSPHPEDSRLKLELNERNPDDGMTEIAYNKGAFFLRTLEELVGRETFDAFLKEYFNEHAFQTISTEKFIRYLNSALLEPNNFTDFNTNEWIYQPGLPENCVTVQSDRLDRMGELAEKLNKGEDVFIGENANMQRGDYITQEWLAFVRALSPNISPDKLAMIDKQLDFSKSANASIKSEWYQLTIKVGYTEARPEIKKHLTLVGRRWLIQGIYQTLRDSDKDGDLEWAKAVFEKVKTNYHFISRSTVREILYSKEK
ncbi:MAG: leukotriene-A4 hydrolase [Flavobacteriaceae bacterium]|jgi:leukotriene-A4 hydrolase